MRKLVPIVIYLCAALPCKARITTVGVSGPADFNTIQAAINDSNDGDIVIVGPGIYTGDGNRDIDFLGKAITVRSTDPNDPAVVADTVIDCNGTEQDPHRGFYFHRWEDSCSVLDGLTITNGYAPNDVLSSGAWICAGGGAYCLQSSPKLVRCEFVGNYADRPGGGI